MNDVMTSGTANIIWHINNKFIKKKTIKERNPYTEKMPALNFRRYVHASVS